MNSFVQMRVYNLGTWVLLRDSPRYIITAKKVTSRWKQRKIKILENSISQIRIDVRCVKCEKYMLHAKNNLCVKYRSMNSMNIENSKKTRQVPKLKILIKWKASANLKKMSWLIKNIRLATILKMLI